MTNENEENLAARIYGKKPNFTTQHQARFICILPCLKIHLGFLFVLVLHLCYVNVCDNSHVHVDIIY